MDFNARIETDAKLIAAAMAGDEQAFRELVQIYQGPVFACTQALTRNPADAADAAQEAFVKGLVDDIQLN